MTDRYEELRDLFTAWVGLRPEERAERLATLIGTDPELAKQLAQLFSADAAVGSLDVLVSLNAGAILPGKLGNFRVIREIGRGGMGVVVEAEQEVPRRRVALKSVVPAHDGTDRYALFRNEVQAMAEVLHPGIPQVYEVFEVDGRPFAAMELVEGEPLLDATARRPGLDARLRILLQVCEAMAHAHARGVVHRDLKPSNILVTPEGVPKVIDFGIARVRECDGPAGSGTLGYVAPEQLAGRPSDARADVYALGAVIWRVLLGGVPVVVERGPVDQIVARKSVVPEPPRTLPIELRAVLRRALDPDPEARYPDAGALADDLGRYLDARPVQALGDTPHARARAFLRRRGRLLARIGAVVLAVVALGAAGAHVWSARVRARHAAEAEAELAALRELAERLGADATEVGAAFDTLVQTASYAETPAIAEAWRWRADHLEGASRTAALVSAWATSPDEESARAALVNLVEQLLDDLRWDAFVHLEALLPRGERPDLETSARLARWEFATAETSLSPEAAPALAPLRSVRPFPMADRGVLLPEGGALAVQHARLALYDARGELVRSLDASDEIGEVDLRGSRAWIRFGQGTEIVARVELPSLELQELVRVAEPMGPMAVDSSGQVVVAQPFPLRRLRRVRDGALAHLSASLEAAELDVSGMLFADLDDDGDEELVATSSGWHGRDLRVVEMDEDEAHTTGRYRMQAAAVALGRDPAGGPWLVTVGFPASIRPFMGTASWLVRLRPGVSPTEIDKRPLPGGVQHLAVVDLDGDGIPDIVTSQGISDRRLLGLHRQLPDGTLAPAVYIPGLSLVAAVDGLLWLTDGVSAWLAGAPGGTPLTGPPPAPAEVAVPVPAHVSDVTRQRWAGIEQIAAAGLREEAGHALADLGAARLGPVGTSALVRAHALLAAAGSGRVVDVATELVARGGLPEQQRAELVRTLLDGHELDALAHVGGAGPASELLQSLAASDTTLALGAAVDARWSVLAPEAVSGRPLQAGVDLRTTLDRGELLALPLAWDGRALALEVELDVLEMDWGAGLELAVEAGGVAQTVFVRRVGGGPAADHFLQVACDHKAHIVGPAGKPTTVRIGITWLGGASPTFGCRTGDGHALVVPAAQPGVGSARLLVRTPTHPRYRGTGLAHLRLRSVRVRGASVGPPDGDPDARAFANAEPGAILRARGGADPLLSALATRAATGSPAAPRGLSDDDLAFLLRTDAPTWAGPIRALTGRRFPAVFERAWHVALAYGEADDVLLLPALAGLSLDEPRGRFLAEQQVEALLRRPGRAAEAGRLLDALLARPDAVEAWWYAARLRADAGDILGAGEALGRYIRSYPSPERAADRARAHSALSALVHPDLAPAATLSVPE